MVSINAYPKNKPETIGELTATLTGGPIKRKTSGTGSFIAEKEKIKDNNAQVVGSAIRATRGKEYALLNQTITMF